MSIKAIIFDLDDTLWPLRSLISRAELSLFAWLLEKVPAIGEHHTVDSLRERRMAMIPTDPRFSYDLWALRHTALLQVLDEFQADLKLADEGMQVFAHARNQVEMFDDVPHALALLQQEYVLATISNGFADLQAIGLAPHFQFSLAAHEFGCAKPDPRIFQAALERLQLPAHEVMYVGDDLRLDVAGAQEVGMRAAWMNRYKMQLHETPHPHVTPDLIVHDLHQLKSAL
jgi:2-haloalkanoic acid dehalogenase type II